LADFTSLNRLLRRASGASRERPRQCALAAALALLLALDLALPPPVPAGGVKDRAVVVLARDGSPLRAFPDRAHVWRHPVGLEEVSPHYLDALLAYEDRWFYWHLGVNPLALLRAGRQWIESGRVVSGGSTLTMQVARILEPELETRRIGGKLKQMVRALQLELRYSKREILTLYLNHAPMGGVLEGVEAASRGYLGKPSLRLSHAEAAMLAVLPQAPSLLRPDRHPAAARAARDKVLRRMQGEWREAAIADALSEPPWSHAPRAPMLAPLLAERLRREVWSAHQPDPQRGEKGEEEGRIQTTIDAAVQARVETLLYDRARTLPPKVSLAALVVDNQKLEVLAYAGSADFSDRERFSDVDMVRASRSPGSALKPFLYAFALDEGLIHSESLLADAPQSFGGYQPGNFQQSFHGPVSVSEALVKSLNVPAVEVLEHLEPQRFVALLRAGGLKLDFPDDAEPNLSVILGGAGVSLENLVGAYTALARQGVAGTPRLLPTDPLVERRMMSEGAAYIVRDILESGGPSARAAVDSADARHGIAWKTGTSFGFRDAWAVGVNDRFTVGVWVGRPDGTPNPGFFGANVAAPLLVDIFSGLPEDRGAALAVRSPPASVTQARICWPLGGRYSPEQASFCHQMRTAWLLADAAPPTFADRLRDGTAVARYQVEASGWRVEADCANGELRTVEVARWPGVLEPWLDAKTRDKALPPAWSRKCGERGGATGGLTIVGVSDGETLQRAANAEMPQVRLDVRGQRGPINWLINGRLEGRAKAGEGFVYRFASAGRYTITALDDAGQYARVVVSVGG
jgi:penicillin-binding protein 1C